MAALPPTPLARRILGKAGARPRAKRARHTRDTFRRLPLEQACSAQDRSQSTAWGYNTLLDCDPLHSAMTEQATFATIANLSRRAFLAAAVKLGTLGAAVVQTDFSALPPYGNGTIPAGIRSRQIANVNGMTVHILEAGYETPGRPAILLLHGFPELAYSWRKVMPSLAAAGYHVIAPDQRGFGRTLGWDDGYDADADPFRILNMTRDAVGLVYALGHRSVAMVVGHDAGAPVASWSALIRPDVFRSITIMSSPFEGAPLLPFDTAPLDSTKAP